MFIPPEDLVLHLNLSWSGSEQRLRKKTFCVAQEGRIPRLEETLSMTCKIMQYTADRNSSYDDLF